MFERLKTFYCGFTHGVHFLAPLVDLGLRLYVAWVFFKSGLVKIQSWDSTLALFLFNIMAVVSYPDLSEVGLQQHLYWGMLLAFLAVHGPGKLSVDTWLLRNK